MSAEGRKTSSFKEAKEGKGVWAQWGPGSQRPQFKSNSSQTYPTGAGKEEGTSTAALKYPLHCAFHSLPRCPGEKTSPQNKKGKKSRVRASFFPSSRGNGCQQRAQFEASSQRRQLLRQEPSQACTLGPMW